MDTTYVAFDIDNTLITNIGVPGKYRKLGVPFEDDQPNEELVSVLKYFSKQKNVRVIVWSGGGADYARMWVRRLGLEDYVWKVGHKLDSTMPKVDIAFDDVEDFKMAKVNVIVKQVDI